MTASSTTKRSGATMLRAFGWKRGASVYEDWGQIKFLVVAGKTKENKFSNNKNHNIWRHAFKAITDFVSSNFRQQTFVLLLPLLPKDAARVQTLNV